MKKQPLPQRSGRQSLSSALPADLPPGWVRVESRSKPGAYYYAHTASGRTQVEKPVEINSRQRAFASIASASSRAPAPAPSVSRAGSSARAVSSTSKAVPAPVVEEDEETAKKRIEMRKAEAEARKKKAEQEALAKIEKARLKAEEEDAEQEAARQRAMQKRAQQLAVAKGSDDDGDQATQVDEEKDKVSMIRRATMQKATRKAEKKKAWVEDDGSGDDNAEVTKEDVEKWREDEERREREEKEAKIREKEEAERRIIEEKLERERQAREAEEAKLREAEEEERRIVEEALEKARIIAEHEEALRKQREEEDRKREEEKLERERQALEQQEAARLQKEAEEKHGQEMQARLHEEYEEAQRLKRQAEELRKQEEALERVRREESDAKRQRFDGNFDAGYGGLPGGEKSVPTQTGTIIWYNGRRRSGIVMADWDRRRLRIAPGGAPNGGIAPPVPGGLMHGTRVSFSLAGGGPGQEQVCYDVMPLEGQVGLSCGGDSQVGQRYTNEDRTIAVDLPEGLGHMVAIFDGHRGTNCADFLAQNLSKTMVAKVQEQFNRWMMAGRTVLSLTTAEEVEVIRSGIVAAFEACDQDILEVAETAGWGDGASALVALVSHGYETPEPGRSTVLSALGGQAKCFAAWCGTGRMLLLRGRQPLRMTKDHVCNDDEERRRLEASGAMLLQDRYGTWVMGRPDRLDLAQQRQQGYEDYYGPKQFLSASRGFGDSMIKQLPYHSTNGWCPQTPVLTATPDVLAMDLTPADWAVVMGGRGIFSVLSDQEVSDVVLEATVAHGKGPVDAAKAVTARAMQRGSKDNLTCIVLRFGWTQPPPMKTLAELLSANKGY